MLIRKEDLISLKCKAIWARLVAFGKNNGSDKQQLMKNYSVSLPFQCGRGRAVFHQ